MRHLRQVGFALLALLLVSASASAQRPRARTSAAQRSIWELGFDSQLAFGFDTPKVTVLSIPAASIRAGYWASDVLSIEPFFSLSHVSVQGGGSGSAYALGAGGLYHFSENRAKSQIYVRPFLTFVGTSGGGASNSDVGVGVGAGMKWPKLGGRIALRGEGNIETINNNTALNLLFGLSFFTR